MGGAVSAGADNDELIDNLLEADYIKTPTVEKVFRAVDRGHYFTPECRDSAYKDLAWKCGNLHISAPCIYSEVLENLKLEPGMSFLNLGSGTGYLNTMAGLILGSTGMNHGIEIHQDVLDYATKRLEEFYLNSPALDEFDFCPPKFVRGNCLCLGSDCRQYDRVYCGAACPENHENYMKNLIKIGGILVMPINDQLLQICRTSETTWETKSVLAVSFATLVSSSATENSVPLKLPGEDPLSLQDICRFAVRSILRRIIDIEHPDLKKRPPRVPRKRCGKKRALRQLVIPIFGSHSESEDNEIDSDDYHSQRDLGRAGFLREAPNGRTCRTIIELREVFGKRNRSSRTQTETKAESSDESVAQTSKMDEEDTVDSEQTDEMTEDENMPYREKVKDAVDEEYSHLVAKSTDFEEMGKESPGESTSAINQKIKAKETKREKFDSGIVEDIENGKAISSDSDEDEDDDFDSQSPKPARSDVRKVRISQTEMRRYSFLKVLDSDSDSENSDHHEHPAEMEPETKDSIVPPAANEPPPPQIDVNTYATYMKEKIKMLPLPTTLKYFINLGREL